MQKLYSQNLVCAIALTYGSASQQVFPPSAERLTWPELHALSSLPFSTAAGWGEPEARVGAKRSA